MCCCRWSLWCFVSLYEGLRCSSTLPLSIPSHWSQRLYTKMLLTDYFRYTIRGSFCKNNCLLSNTVKLFTHVYIKCCKSVKGTLGTLVRLMVVAQLCAFFRNTMFSNEMSTTFHLVKKQQNNKVCTPVGQRRISQTLWNLAILYYSSSSKRKYFPFLCDVWLCVLSYTKHRLTEVTILYLSFSVWYKGKKENNLLTF